MSSVEEQHEEEEEEEGECTDIKAEGEGQNSLTSSTLPLIVTIVEDTIGFNFIWFPVTNNYNQRKRQK